MEYGTASVCRINCHWYSIVALNDATVYIVFDVCNISLDMSSMTALQRRLPVSIYFMHRIVCKASTLVLLIDYGIVIVTLLDLRTL